MTTLTELAQFFAESEHFSGAVREDEILAGHTTMHVGGKAGLFLGPADEGSLVFAIAELKRAGFPYFVLGGGSNLIISDSGFDGAIISTRGLKKVESLTKNPSYPCHPNASYLIAGAGAAWGSVMAFCREYDLGGLEGFTGLSGTVGGALYMNATCFGLSACDRLVTVRYLDTESGEIGEYVMDEEKRAADWGYKKSPFQSADGRGWARIGGVTGESPVEGVAQNGSEADGWSEGVFATSHRRSFEGTSPLEKNIERTSPAIIILSATFALAKGFDAVKSDDCIAQRKEKGHFFAPSAGSVFKNVVQDGASGGVIAGKVIDECGLKGLQIGGAQVAPWHGNFIVNTGDASAQDIFDLVQLVRKIVREKKGILLECEIIFVGMFFVH